MQTMILNKLKNSPIKSIVQQAALGDPLHVRKNATASLSPNKAKERTLSSFTTLAALPNVSTEKLRHKVQEAMAHATEKATSILSAAAAGASQSSSYFSNASADAAESYHKLQFVFRQSKQKYRCIPFDDRWDDIQRSLAVLGRVSTGNKVTPYRDSGDAFRDMWAAVDGAKKSVLWQTYICKDDYIGQTTIRKMVAACQERHCHTELLYDCGGNITGRSRLTNDLKQCGATVIQYRPFFKSFFQYMSKGLDWRRSPGLRNHRKILITDSAIGFCGGLNIGNEYCGTSMGGSGKFRDTHCAVEGPAVADLQQVYDDAKMPQPWKYGLARWRQIASVKLNRSYEAGRHTFEAGLQTVEERLLRPLQTRTREVTASGGVYFRKQVQRAEETVMRRIRWQARTGQKNDTVKRKTAVTDADVSTTEDKRSNAMQRKVLKDRMQAWSVVNDLPHKRDYTNLLLLAPLKDTEAVPEAELYALSRPNTTQILLCNPRYRDYSIQYAFWQVTRKCHRRLWITTPYYLPTRKLFKALLHTASRGVDVRILAGSSTTTDPWWMWHASKYITERLLRGGVKIYEYKGPGIMHAKTIVVDSVWSSIGSYNWDVMSNKNLEVCLIQLDAVLAREMESHFCQDLALSEEVKLEDHQQRSLSLRFLSWMFYNAVYILNRITFRSFSNQDVRDSPDIPG